MQDRVYRAKVQGVDDLEQRLIDVWDSLEQSVIDVCIRAKGTFRTVFATCILTLFICLFIRSMNEHEYTLNGITQQDRTIVLSK